MLCSAGFCSSSRLCRGQSHVFSNVCVCLMSVCAVPMAPLTPSVALPCPRTPLSLPSCSSPSLRVRFCHVISYCRWTHLQINRFAECPVPSNLQTPPLLLTGCCPPTTTTTLWSTAAPTLVCCTWSSPGSWAENPPCLRRPWRICTARWPPSESMWTSWSPPTRIQFTAGPWATKQTGGHPSVHDNAINMLKKASFAVFFFDPELFCF